MAFFDDKEDKAAEEEGQQEPEKIKVGDQEFAPDELAGIVGDYQKISKDYGSLDKLKSSWGQRGQKIGQLESELQELRDKQEQESIATKQETGAELSPDELVKMAEQQGLVTQRSINAYIENYMQAKELVDTCKDFEGKTNPYESKDLPKFDTVDMLQYMDKTGLKNPADAYDVRYKDEIAKWRESEISKARGQSGMVTETAATGNKQPKPIKVDRGNLSDSVAAALGGEI